MCCRKWEVDEFLPISLDILGLLDQLEGNAWRSRHILFGICCLCPVGSRI